MPMFNGFDFLGVAAGGGDGGAGIIIIIFFIGLVALITN